MELSERIQRNLATISFFVIVVSLAVGLFFAVFQNDRFALLTAMLLAAVAIPWYLSFRQGRIELFEPIIFYSIFFAMLVFGWIERVYFSPPSLRYEFISLTFADAFFLVGTVMLFLFLSVLLGYYALAPRFSRRFSAVGHRIRNVLRAASKPSGSAFRAIGGGYMIIGFGSIIMTIIFVFPTGEILYLYTNTTPRSKVFSGNSIFVFFSRTLYIGYMLWLCGAIVERRSPSIGEYLLAIPITGAFLILGGRGRALSVVIIAIIFWYYTTIEEIFPLHHGFFVRLTNRIPPSVLLVSLPVSALVIAFFIIPLRGVRMSKSFTESLMNVDPFSILTVAAADNAYDNFLGLMEFVPDEVGYFYGTFYVRVLLNFIPRSIWPAKPTATSGSLFRRLALPDASGGRPPGAMGEYYLNFGLPGIPLLGAIHGILLYLTWQLVKGTRVSVVEFIIFIFLLSAIGKNGLVNNALFTLFSNIILTIPAILILIKWDEYIYSKSYNRKRGRF